MPIPVPELARWLEARVRLERAVLPPLPLSLKPSAWVLSACAPHGQPGDDDDARHRALLTSLSQSKLAHREVVLELPDRSQAAVLVQGIDRARAVRLGYKRKQWAVLGFEGDRVVVVYTGLDSHMR